MAFVEIHEGYKQARDASESFLEYWRYYWSKFLEIFGSTEEDQDESSDETQIDPDEETSEDTGDYNREEWEEYIRELEERLREYEETERIWNEYIDRYKDWLIDEMTPDIWDIMEWLASYAGNGDDTEDDPYDGWC
ncbi:MAG: hypothetical protein ACW98Y_18995 [Candidatus Thorarchaeota archaeon]|jgi:hypothetical protein